MWLSHKGDEQVRKTLVTVAMVIVFSLTWRVTNPAPIMADSVTSQKPETADVDWTGPSGTISGPTITVSNWSFHMDIHSFGYGVYYFEYQNGYDYRMYGKVFAETLVFFLKRNDNLEVVSLAANLSAGQDNRVIGYFVVVKRKTK